LVLLPIKAKLSDFPLIQPISGLHWVIAFHEFHKNDCFHPRNWAFLTFCLLQRQRVIYPVACEMVDNDKEQRLEILAVSITQGLSEKPGHEVS